jgi:hypothetical protein
LRESTHRLGSFSKPEKGNFSSPKYLNGVAKSLY